MVFHLPCSFQCKPSIELAEQLEGIARSLGFQQEADWLTEMLHWPVQWSALHGIAEIKTPIAKLSANTDATGTKHTVNYLGNRYPEEGVPGLTFPYQPPKAKRISDANGLSLD